MAFRDRLKYHRDKIHLGFFFYNIHITPLIMKSLQQYIINKRVCASKERLESIHATRNDMASDRVNNDFIINLEFFKIIRDISHYSSDNLSCSNSYMNGVLLKPLISVHRQKSPLYNLLHRRLESQAL